MGNPALALTEVQQACKHLKLGNACTDKEFPKIYLPEGKASSSFHRIQFLT